jgi:hypothetical protein
MRDLVVIAIVIGFFALCVAYVRWCERIIGPDPDLDELVADADPATSAHAAEAMSS